MARLLSPSAQLFVAATNLFIAAAGAGILSYPFAVKSQGIVLNVLLSLCFAALNCYTDLVLATTAFRVRRSLVALTYEEICLRVLGPWGYVGAVSTVIVGCFGVLIGFMVITADLVQPVIVNLCGSGDLAVCNVLSNRSFILLVFAVGVALPFSSCERMHGLVGSSAVAAITVIVVAFLVGAKGIEAMASGGLVCSGPNAKTSPYLDGSTVWFNFSAEAILGVPLIVFALGNHIQVRVCDACPSLFPRSNKRCFTGAQRFSRIRAPSSLCNQGCATLARDRGCR